MSLDVLPFGIAHHMALIPLLWLAIKGRNLGAAWWWIGAIFGISWLADTAAHWVSPWVIGAVYPVSQAAIIGAVFLSRRDALMLAIGLVIAGIIDLFWHGATGPDILLRTVAWLSVVGIVYELRQLERLRIALLVTFGLGWLCWMGYVVTPGWWSWGTYQSVRLAGILLFCWAVTRPHPRFRVLNF